MKQERWCGLDSGGTSGGPRLSFMATTAARNPRSRGMSGCAGVATTKSLRLVVFSTFSPSNQILEATQNFVQTDLLASSTGLLTFRAGILNLVSRRWRTT